MFRKNKVNALYLGIFALIILITTLFLLGLGSTEYEIEAEQDFAVIEEELEAFYSSNQTYPQNLESLSIPDSAKTNSYDDSGNLEYDYKPSIGYTGSGFCRYELTFFRSNDSLGLNSTDVILEARRNKCDQLNADEYQSKIIDAREEAESEFSVIQEELEKFYSTNQKYPLSLSELPVPSEITTSSYPGATYRYTAQEVRGEYCSYLINYLNPDKLDVEPTALAVYSSENCS